MTVDPDDPALRRRLIEAAQAARQRAHAPYSRFLVGAAVLTDQGRIVPGCNVENISYGATICAERTALFACRAEGAGQPVMMAVIAELDQPVAPCGICRQVLAELAPDCWVLMANLAGAERLMTARDLLPAAFRFDGPPRDP